MGRILTAYNLLFLFDVLTKVLNDITKSSVNCNPITRSHTSHSQLFILWCSDEYRDVKKKTVKELRPSQRLPICHEDNVPYLLFTNFNYVTTKPDISTYAPPTVVLTLTVIIPDLKLFNNIYFQL